MSAYEYYHGRDLDEGTVLLMKERAKQNSTVVSHFLDSGSFTLWTTARKYAEKHGCGRWDYYDTDEFWQYMDAYAAFIKKYQIAIDLYANVDVIPNPKLSWRNLKYLERKHVLHPVPVVHYTTPLKWLRRHIDAGYGLIGLGGLVGSAHKRQCQHWIDQCFEMVADAEGRPTVKLHGFGVTSFKLLLRYPWWSVDSVTWAKQGAFGSIFVPPKRGGQFVFSKPPFQIVTSLEAKAVKVEGKHYTTMRPGEKRIVLEWLNLIGIPLGRSKGEDVIEYGVINRHTERRAANLLYFERLRQSLPEWPWPFRKRVSRGGLGV